MPVRVLGIDPGLTRCGIGLIEQGAGRTVRLLRVDTLRSDTSLPLAQRILGLALALEALLIESRPNTIALERVFAQANVASVMGTAQISGVILMLAAKHGIPVALHTPTEVKAAVTGNGRATKQQVGNIVAKILGLAEVPRPADAADALAIAITHAWRIGVAAGGETGSAGTSNTKAQDRWREAIESSKKVATRD